MNGSYVVWPCKDFSMLGILDTVLHISADDGEMEIVGKRWDGKVSVGDVERKGVLLSLVGICVVHTICSVVCKYLDVVSCLVINSIVNVILRWSRWNKLLTSHRNDGVSGPSHSG